jgi:DegV family protein with EDD domain
VTFTLLTDSTSDLKEQWAREHDVEVLGLLVNIDGIEYDTFGGQAITANQLLDKMAAGVQPTTSQINAGEFEELFRSYAQQDKSLLYVALSSALSGTYQSACIARDIVLEEYPDATILVFDSKTVASGLGIMVREAVALRQQGQSIEQVYEALENSRQHLKTFFLVDDLQHLVRGGRLSKTAALIGGLAKIKPILELNLEGKLVPYAKVRGKKKALTQIMNQGLENIDKSGHVIIGYTGEDTVALGMKATLLDEGIQDIELVPLNPVIAAHTGPDTIALFTKIL